MLALDIMAEVNEGAVAPPNIETIAIRVKDFLKMNFLTV